MIELMQVVVPGGSGRKGSCTLFVVILWVERTRPTEGNSFLFTTVLTTPPVPIRSLWVLLTWLVPNVLQTPRQRGSTKPNAELTKLL